MQRVGPQVAAEAAGSTFPIAVQAAWAAASLLPSSTVLELTRAMGHVASVKAATIITDEFPGLVKTPVLGRRSKHWRGPAAIAMVLMANHADDLGITY